MPTPARSTSARDAERERWADFYTRAHPDQPRVGDVPGQPYQPVPDWNQQDAANPCLTPSGHRRPGCHN